MILENQGKGTIVVLPPAAGASGTPTQVQQKLGGYTLDISYTSGGILGARPAQRTRADPFHSVAARRHTTPRHATGRNTTGATPSGTADATRGRTAHDACTTGGAAACFAAEPVPGRYGHCHGTRRVRLRRAGLNVKFTPATPGRAVSLASFDESIYVNGRWVPGRRLNGDETNNNKRWPSMAGFGIYRIKLY